MMDNDRDRLAVLLEKYHSLEVRIGLVEEKVNILLDKHHILDMKTALTAQSITTHVEQAKDTLDSVLQSIRSLESHFHATNLQLAELKLVVDSTKKGENGSSLSTKKLTIPSIIAGVITGIYWVYELIKGSF